ncbi:hypothetical protein ACLF3G_21330 [Falsiroseomonas sp. HC035]|uniref:hypothetical protein n=1 Tax=Falsiroseomonas sp. HC035 TaxID=3390999 RepID=UPI003D3124EF
MAVPLIKRIRRFLFARKVGRLRFGALASPDSFSGALAAGQDGLAAHYTTEFLAARAALLRGRILVAGALPVALPDAQVTRIGVAELDQGGLPGEDYDGAVLVDVLGQVDDPHEGLRRVVAACRPGALLLATLPGVVRAEPGFEDTHQWRFTQHLAKLMFEAVAPPASVRVTAHGNVLAAVACAAGSPATALSRAQRDRHDAPYPLVIGVQAAR